jgi:hypothetical protein
MTLCVSAQQTVLRCGETVGRRMETMFRISLSNRIRGGESAFVFFLKMALLKMFFFFFFFFFFRFLHLFPHVFPFSSFVFQRLNSTCRLDTHKARLRTKHFSCAVALSRNVTHPPKVDIAVNVKNAQFVSCLSTCCFLLSIVCSVGYVNMSLRRPTNRLL